jgi:hypothetical protein
MLRIQIGPTWCVRVSQRLVREYSSLFFLQLISTSRQSPAGGVKTALGRMPWVRDNITMMRAGKANACGLLRRQMGVQEKQAPHIGFSKLLIFLALHLMS